MHKIQGIIKVAVPAPLYQIYDYLIPKSCNIETIQPGMRVRIPFGHATKIGMIVQVVDTADTATYRIKHAFEILDKRPIIPPGSLTLFRWAAKYYHHPLGEVIFSSIPPPLRHGKAEAKMMSYLYLLTNAGKEITSTDLPRAPKQAAMLAFFRRHPKGVRKEQLCEYDAKWRATLRSLTTKGWVTAEEHTAPPPAITEPDKTYHPFRLNLPQTRAVDAVCAHLDRFSPFLLNGITGSGKTEVYLHIIDRVISRGKQALVLIPEIGLTPQLVARFTEHLGVPLAVLHSGLSDKERLHAWLMARDGNAQVVIGTRSAIFTPLPQPGICIIDEEHDPSFKQQEGFRYHARDLAVMRARQDNIPIVLGSATPSLESLHNVSQERYHHLLLNERIGNAQQPAIHLLDMRSGKHKNNLSPALLTTIKSHLDLDNQVLLFLNRRGYAPTLYCQACGWIALCQRCDAHMIQHQSMQRIRCHHCDAQQSIPTQCPQCGGQDLHALGQGTERIEEALQLQFQDVEIIRFDRDSTRRKGSMQALLKRVQAGQRQILLGTQMIAKGHHLPNITLVGILDADQGLFGADFRAIERMGQLILQVAGRAGRADKPGEVLIQTHFPEHPAFHALLTHDYHGFTTKLLEERQLGHLPPYAALALFRAEAADKIHPARFLQDVHQQASVLSSTLWGQCPQGSAEDRVRLLGPVTPPMEKRAGRYRAQLLLQSGKRGCLHSLLNELVPTIEKLPSARKVRWSLDIDPQESF